MYCVVYLCVFPVYRCVLAGDFFQYEDDVLFVEK